MELLILYIIVTILFVALMILISFHIKLLNKESHRLLILKKSFKTADNLTWEIKNLNDINKSQEEKLVTLEKYLKMFIKGQVKVFVNSNFYSNFNVYNNKYYAKINKNLTNNKAEGIPVLTHRESKYIVIDLYKLNKLIFKLPNNLTENIENSFVFKEDLVKELGNKVLKPYKNQQ